jgi:enoyl-CoA hydratase/carnithine racemase
VHQTVLTDRQVPTRVEDGDGVRCVILDRPEMTEPMYDRITHLLINAAHNPALSCAVLSGPTPH